MSTALDFTVDIGSLPTRDQGPKKMQVGGVTESTKMLAEAPPTSLVDNNPILVPPPKYERETFKPRFDDATPMNPMEYGIKQEVDPSNLQRMKELGMILQAQKDLSGIMMANREPKKGIEFLMERTYTI